MAKASRNPGTAGVSRRAGGGKVTKNTPTPIAKTKGQASINDGKQLSKERLQQVKEDRERTAAILKYVAHHRDALLRSLEPSVLCDRYATRNGILRRGRRWFHGESDAVRQAFFAGKSVSLDVGACPLERRPDGIAESGGGGGSAAVTPCARQTSPKTFTPAARSLPRAAEPAITPIAGVGPAAAALEPTESAVAEAASLAAIGPIGGIVSTVAAQAPAGSLDATLWQQDLVGHLPAMVELFGLPSGVEILASAFRLVPHVTGPSFRAGVRRQTIVAGVLSAAAKFVIGVAGPMLQSFWRRILGDGNLSELKAAEFVVFEAFALQSCQGEYAREWFLSLAG